MTTEVENQPMTVSELDEAIAAADRRLEELQNQRDHQAQEVRAALGLELANVEQYTDTARQADHETLQRIDSALEEARQHKAALVSARPEVVKYQHAKYVEKKSEERDAIREQLNALAPEITAAVATLEGRAKRYGELLRRERDIVQTVARANGNIEGLEARAELPTPGVKLDPKVTDWQELQRRVESIKWV